MGRKRETVFAEPAAVLEILPAGHDLEQTAISTVPKAALAEQAKTWEEQLVKFAEDYPADETFEPAWEAIRDETHQRLSELDDERKELKAPSLKACQDIDADYKKYTAPGVKLKELAKGKLASIAQARLEADNDAARAAQAAAEAGDEEGVGAALAKLSDKGASFTWGYEIVSEALLDRAFLTPDVRALDRVAAQAGDTEPKVAGVKFFKVAKAGNARSKKS